jgi:hypothetical protein
MRIAAVHNMCPWLHRAPPLRLSRESLHVGRMGAEGGAGLTVTAGLIKLFIRIYG